MKELHLEACFTPAQHFIQAGFKILTFKISLQCNKKKFDD